MDSSFIQDAMNALASHKVDRTFFRAQFRQRFGAELPAAKGFDDWLTGRGYSLYAHPDDAERINAVVVECHLMCRAIPSPHVEKGSLMLLPNANSLFLSPSTQGAGT